jgi:hypothetical protein
MQGSGPLARARFIARIERDRDAALAKHRRDRDSGALDKTMARLDA